MSTNEAYACLDKLLANFGASRENGKSTIIFTNPVSPSFHGSKINLSLVGSIPSTACAVLASQIHESRTGQSQIITTDLSRGSSYIDPDEGMTPSLNGQEIPVDVVIGNPFLRNIFETKDGRFVVLSAVYVDLVYKWLTFLGCGPEEGDVRERVRRWESDTAKAGLPAALVHSEEEWAATPQGSYLHSKPIVPITKVNSTPPIPWPSQTTTSASTARPLQGIKVLCATHAIAGPSAGRTLAEHGASVLQIMFTHGFEHAFVYNNANLGCASARLNFHKVADVQRMWELIHDADVWVDSYRDGALAKFGFTDEKMTERNGKLIISHVRCFGYGSPWGDRAGFDMQGSAASGMMAYCGEGALKPKWPQASVINDYTTGFLGALAILSTLLRRSQEGGAYVLAPSLVGTAMSILKYFKATPSSSASPSPSSSLTILPSQPHAVPSPPYQISRQTALGYLRTWAPLPQLSLTPARYDPILLVPIGSSLPCFPGSEEGFKVESVEARSKKNLVGDVAVGVLRKLKQLKEMREELEGLGENECREFPEKLLLLG
ncbi:CoA-transferase family III domain-containing protein [Cadophora sp. MPI-SDFR-AT-0126]|nr:CoA-transferase family III domain-containing protein [Leotiomycetes sp. MPI-SDFR-AT-0126]